MRSTPERVEALRRVLTQTWTADTKRELQAMLSECEQKLPKPLVFDSDPSGTYNPHEYLAHFNRALNADDCAAIRAALTKAFPAKEQP